MLGIELMSLPRLTRRIVAQNLYELIDKYKYVPDALARRHIDLGEFILLLIAYPNDKSKEEKDFLIKHAGQIYFHKLNIQNKLVVLGAPFDLSESKYAVLIKDGESDPEAIAFLEELCGKWGWFKNMKLTEKTYKEFPNEK